MYDVQYKIKISVLLGLGYMAPMRGAIPLQKCICVTDNHFLLHNDQYETFKIFRAKEKPMPWASKLGFVNSKKELVIKYRMQMAIHTRDQMGFLTDHSDFPKHQKPPCSVKDKWLYLCTTVSS